MVTLKIIQTNKQTIYIVHTRVALRRVAYLAIENTGERYTGHRIEIWIPMKTPFQVVVQTQSSASSATMKNPLSPVSAQGELTTFL